VRRSSEIAACEDDPMIPRNRTKAAILVATAALFSGTFMTSLGSPAGASASAAPTDQFNQKNFDNPATGSSKWLPLVPGTQIVKLGSVNRGHRKLQHRVVTTVTDVTKEIDGVRAVAVLDQDIDGGEIGEQSIDYLAEDKFGNVWTLGSYTEAYEGGQFVNANDGWLTGTDGAKAGLLMPANPTKRTPPWVEEDIPGAEHSTAEVAEIGVKNCVPFKCYKNVLVVQEGGEYKYYAFGVGSIRTGPKNPGSGDNEIEKLINVTKLSPAGLKELGDEVLNLDQHARKTVASVYGQSQAAKRTL
jgi:hypothetical protein